VDKDFRVGAWLVQPSLNTISQNGTSTRVEPKVMEVLVCLSHRAGKPVSKEELLETVWRDTFVSDDVLKRCVSELRRVFEDDARESRIIETIPKRGYRLVAPVQPVNGQAPTKTDLRPSEIGRRALGTKPSKWKIGLGAAASVALVCGILFGLNISGVRDRLFRKNVPLMHSIAVLPLQNLSGDPSQEYFADGMTEELITELSRISGLKVISRTSIMRYKGSSKSLPEIARELGVDGIVEGSVLRSGNQARITAQLIYAPQDTNVWAETYDRDLSNVLALQSEIATTIAGTVKVKATLAEKEHLNNARQVNVEALDAYLRGEHHLNRYGRGFGDEEDKQAISYFQQAIAAEPSFAKAYVEMANAYEGLMLPVKQRWPMERVAAEKAVSLDPDLAEAHFTMGHVKFFYEWDFPAAGREFKRAIELDPNNAEAHGWYALYLSSVGRRNEGRAEARLAQQLDPVHYLECAYDQPGDEDRGINLLQNYIELNPEDGHAHMNLAELYARKGMQEQHISELQKTAVFFGFRRFARDIAQAYATSGYRTALRAWALGLDRLKVNRPVMVAEAYARAGNRGLALDWLERAYREHDDDMVELNADPAWDSLRADPRFEDLVRHVGLPQSEAEALGDR